MTPHVEWKAEAHYDGVVHLWGHAQGPNHELATAGADRLLIEGSMYGVPEDVPPELIFRFSRCKSEPRGRGGGSAALRAALELLDEMGAWSVLEASPYPGQDTNELYAFYEKHGFRHHPNERGIMHRPPRGPR